MQPDRETTPPKRKDTPAQLRQRAVHVRRIARDFYGDDAADRLSEYAQELEERAKRIEDEG